MRLKHFFLLFFSVFFLSCNKDYSSSGSGINFSATSEDDGSSVSTKTTYTGDGSKDNNKLVHERIDWVKGDLITIVSSQAKFLDKSSRPWTLVFNGTGGGYSTANYKVKSFKKRNSTVSRASIAPVGGSGLQWGERNESFVFYSMYPSNATAGYSAQEKAKIGLTPSTIKATIPESQTPQWNNNGWPDMKYAYMFASSGSVSYGASVVNLKFKPLYTAFEFSLTNGDFDSVELTSFTLESLDDGVSLSGDFAGSIQMSGENLSLGGITASNTSKTITVDLTGKTVTASNPLRFTILALPFDIGRVKMSFTGPVIGTRSVVFKRIVNGQEEDILFEGRKKYRIANIAFPNIDFVGVGEEILWDLECLGQDLTWIHGVMPDLDKVH